MFMTLLLPVALTLVGVVILVKTRFFLFLHPIKTCRSILDGLKDRSARRALWLALAGTLGVGNIFGVSAGIMIGGAGCLFWIFFSSFFSMMVKYSEILLTFDSNNKRSGFSSVILSSFGGFGRPAYIVYTVATVLLALFMGAGIQVGALSDVSKNALGLNPSPTAFFLLILFIPCMIGGAERIEKITEIIIPLTTIIYIIMCFGVVFVKIERFSDVIYEVFTSAFSFRSCAGGTVAIAIKEGFSRGVLSNEAGLGTSSLAHSRSKVKCAHTAGLFGICEVFFDTTLLCCLTGLAILISTPNYSEYKTPMSLIYHTFAGTLGDFFGIVLLFLILAFSYSTVICWYFYGLEHSRAIHSKSVGIFPLLFIAFFFVGGMTSSTFILYSTDMIILLMSLITLITIMINRKRITKPQI